MATEKQRQPIRTLPTGVVNKIAAGEVIERPASVVKELLENAVDAGADRIEVSIENGGIDLIRVADNGCGIPGDELDLAVTSHATSKIRDADELFCVQSFGFRGEALASIASISQLLLRSRTEVSDCGHELVVQGGTSEPLAACGMPCGTTIEVRNLFFNTPVRRKFLRTPQTERGHVVEAFTRIALANPQVHLTLRHNDKVQHDLPPTSNWSQRIADFFGPEINAGLIPVGNHGDHVQLDGFVVDPSVNRGHNRMQFLFLNGRYIRDRSLQHALSEAYRGLLMTGRYPIVFLNLNMPPQMVDVNVHPAKLEVRFQDGGRIYSQLLATIRNKFLTTDLTARANLSPHTRHDRQGNPVTESVPAAESDSVPFNLQALDPGQQERLRFPTDLPARDWTTPNPRGQLAPEFQPFPSTSSATNEPLTSQRLTEATSLPQQPSSSADLPPARTTALQVHNTYLISETDEGMVIIDQHALHERILYEQLRSRVLNGQLETQKLLVPEPVMLPPAEAALVLEHADLFEQMGMTVEPFGGGTILVSAFPAMLANHNPSETLKSMVELLLNDGRQVDRRDLVDEMLHMISCKAAVKAGDKLTPQEIHDLLEHRDYCQDAHHCPHGRPTALVFSREELDKRFKRI